ncbi:MAG: PAS domain-containing protein [Lachnospiraceae bacterium]|nr:PAS domain-containing protein [Lachnospiraceae bacterium]
MEEKKERRERYSDGFALTKYTLPVVWQMADVIPGGFFIYKEADKRELIYASKRVLEIFGCENLAEFKELTGYTFDGMVYKEDFDRIQASIDSQIDSDEGDSMDYVVYRIVRKDGEIRWVDDYGHYSYSPEYGDVYYVFISDITDKKKMHDSEERIRNLTGRLNNIVDNVDEIKEILDDKEAAAAKLETLKNDIAILEEKILKAVYVDKE